MSQMPPPPPPPPPTGGTDTDRQTGTVKPQSASKAMEAWTLWQRIQHEVRQWYLTVRGWFA